MKKFLTLLLAAVLVLGCFAGCGESYKDDTVMVVNGTEISYDEFCYWLGYSSSYLQYIYSSYTGSNTVDWDAASLFDENLTNYEWCVENAKDTIVRECVVQSEFEAKGLELNDDEKAELETTLENAAKNWCGKNGTQDDLREYLAGVNINYDYYRQNLEMNLKSNSLFAEIYGDNGEKLTEHELIKYADENGYVNANHILIMTVDENTNKALSDSEIEKRTQLAKDIAAELQGITGADELMERFAQLKAEYCDDLKYRAKCSKCEESYGIHKADFDAGKLACPNCGTANKADSFTYSDNAEGYLFTEGTMVTEFYEACLGLSCYQVSDPVKSNYGYHIIVRLPLDTEKKVTAYSSGSSKSFGATAADELFSAMLDEKAEAATHEYVNDFTDASFRELFSDSGFTLKSFAEYSGKEED